VSDPNPLKRVKVGDQAQATFTDAIAISVEPAPRRRLRWIRGILAIRLSRSIILG
jgi:hypothetical protein